jgi:serine protease
LQILKNIPQETAIQKIACIAFSWKPWLLFCTALLFCGALGAALKTQTIAKTAVVSCEIDIPKPVSPTPSPAQRFVPGSILIKIKPAFRSVCLPNQIDLPDLAAILAEGGFRSSQKTFPHVEHRSGQNDLGHAYVDLSTIYEFKGDSQADVMGTIKKISRHPAVAYAEPRWISEVLYVPTDPFHVYQWYADSIYAHGAWDITQGDTNVVIGFIDTGTSFIHPELDGDRVAFNYADPIDGLDNDQDGYVDNWRGWDFSGTTWNSGPDNDPSFAGSGAGMDHGVLVTGAACSRGNNGQGICGIGLNTRYLPLKASPDASTSITHGYDAVVYAATHGVDILNLSWGGPGFSNFAQDVIEFAAVNHACLIVAAAGNRHVNELTYPASYKYVTSVAAIAAGDAVWTGGGTVGTTFNHLIDISAFGQNILTTAGETNYWGGATGTSMAAPLVCATGALVKAQNPTLNGLQIGEILRVSALDHYAQNPEPELHERLGLGRLHALRALTLPNLVSLRLDSLHFDDNANNIPEPYDTVALSPRFINYLSPIPLATIQLSVEDTALVEVIQSNSSLGAMATLSSALTNSPFSFRIKKELTQPKKVYFRFGFSSGNYQDYEYVLVTISPRRMDLDANGLKTSMSSFGSFGYADVPDYLDGLGMEAGSIGPILRDGGFLIGQPSTGKLLSGTINDTLHRDLDFTPTGKPSILMPGPMCSKEVITLHNDAHAGTNQIGIELKQHVYQDGAASNSKFVVLQYEIKNTGTTAATGLYAGLQLAWDAGWASISQAKYHAASKAMVAKFTQQGNVVFAGVSLLTDEAVHGNSVNFIQSSLSRSSRLNSLSASPNLQPSPSLQPIQTLGGGSFDILPGNTHTIAFALAYGADSAEFQLNAATARQFYHCTLMQEQPQPPIPAHTYMCAGMTMELNAGPASNAYLWSNGAATPSIQVSQSGNYSVTVTSPHGCMAAATSHVTVRDLALTHTLTLPHNPSPGILLPFEVVDIGNALISCNWDFGDGILGIGNPLQHNYASPGTYLVMATVSDGACTETFSGTIRVDNTNAVIDPGTIGWDFFPNPSTGRISIHFQQVPSSVEIWLHDALGREIHHYPFPAGSTSDYFSLEFGQGAAGTYFLRVEADGVSTIRKVLKQ